MADANLEVVIPDDVKQRFWDAIQAQRPVPDGYTVEEWTENTGRRPCPFLLQDSRPDPRPRYYLCTFPLARSSIR